MTSVCEHQRVYRDYMDLLDERILLADAIDSQAPLRHMERTATVASFRTWRDLQPTIAQDPAINSVRKRFYYPITVFCTSALLLI